MAVAHKMDPRLIPRLLKIAPGLVALAILLNIGLFAGAAYEWFDVVTPNMKTQTLTAKAAPLPKSEKSMIPALTREIKTAQAQLKRLQTKLPDAITTPQALTEIYSAAHTSGATITSVSFGASSTASTGALAGLVSLQATVGLSATSPQAIIQFAQALSTAHYPASTTLANLSFVAPILVSLSVTFYARPIRGWKPKPE